MYDDLLNQYISEEMYYTEAVFDNGRKKVEPIVKAFENVKIEFDRIDDKANKEKKKWEKFWKSQVFKDLEDSVCKVFGFRDAQIEPHDQVYFFQPNVRIMNAYVWSNKRFPIDGLVTKNGFYDSTHSIRMQIILTLGIIQELSATEMTAVLIHEFGHAIDPALVDINYHDTNVLSKYMMDRKGALNKIEEKEAEKKGIIKIIADAFNRNKEKGQSLSAPAESHRGPIQAILDFITGGAYTTLRTKSLLAEIKLNLKSDKDEFDRVTNSEAFADNFARMYGLGADLMSGLRKVSAGTDNYIADHHKLEIGRQKAIINMTLDMIHDVHKTDIHRIYSLLKEYQADINDPNIPAETKKALKEDMMNLKAVLDEYQNNFTDAQNRVNQLLSEELKKKYKIDIDKMIEDAKEDNKKEEKK